MLYHLLFVLIVLQFGSSFQVQNGADGVFLIGTGIGDITGPAAEVGMMGYGDGSQTTGGIHFRQRARAFVIKDANTGSTVVYVNMDICFVTIMVKKQVVDRLNVLFPGNYSTENVLMTATHTHSGPGGFSWYTLYDITTLGWKKMNVDAVVAGVVDAISQAHNNLTPGRLLLNVGELSSPQSNINRSPTAYMNNPTTERSKYSFDVEKETVVLKLVNLNNQELGVINWFAVHGTSMNHSNMLISGDNKGYAMYLFEQKMNGGLPGTGKFVAAFTNPNEGDVSPNTLGAFCPDGTRCDAITSTCGGRSELCAAIGPGKDMFDSTRIIGLQQFQSAYQLFQTANTSVRSGVGYVHQFADMQNQTVDSYWTGEKTAVKTCLAALGDSFAAGTTDGCGDFDFTQGSNSTGNPFWNWIASFLSDPTPEQIQCHYPKPILLNTGGISFPTPWSPSVLPLQIVNIGQLYIISVPGEFSTMAGRRLKDTVKASLLRNGAPKDLVIVIAGLANGYSQYTTTKEEYNIQRYEGASTLYGPNQLAAYQQLYDGLAMSLATGKKPNPGPTPIDWTNNLVDLQPGVWFDDGPTGDVITQVKPSYKKGETVHVKFYSAHPNNKLRDTFLTVDRQLPNGSWQVVATDGNWETKFIWKRITSIELGESSATIEWAIPLDAQSGTYRITHYGDKKVLFGSITPFTTHSASFRVD